MEARIEEGSFGVVAGRSRWTAPGASLGVGDARAEASRRGRCGRPLGSWGLAERLRRACARCAGLGQAAGRACDGCFRRGSRPTSGGATRSAGARTHGGSKPLGRVGSRLGRAARRSEVFSRARERPAGPAAEPRRQGPPAAATPTFPRLPPSAGGTEEKDRGSVKQGGERDAKVGWEDTRESVGRSHRPERRRSDVAERTPAPGGARASRGRGRARARRWESGDRPCECSSGPRKTARPVPATGRREGVRRRSKRKT